MNLNSCAYFRLALETVGHLADHLDLTEYASRILHPLVRTLDNTPSLQMTAMDTLTALVRQLAHHYTIFIPMVNRVVQKHKISHDKYDVLLCKIIKVDGVFNAIHLIIIVNTPRGC